MQSIENEQFIMYK